MNEKVVILAVVAFLIFLNKLFLAAIFDHNQRSSYFPDISGSALFNHILSTHYVESSFICGNLCLRNKQCLSFNFGTVLSRGATFSCQLSSSDSKRSSMVYKKLFGVKKCKKITQEGYNVSLKGKFKILKKTYLSKSGCHNNINFDGQQNVILNCPQITGLKITKFGGFSLHIKKLYTSKVRRAYSP